MVLRADPVLVAVLGALALSACASAGRTAAWERPPAPPSGTTTSSTSSTAVTRLEAQAQAHWARRDEPAEVREAIRAWEALLAEDAASVEARVMSSRAHYYLADALLAPEGAPPEEELEAYRRGVEHGEQALLRMAPDFEARMRAGEHFEDAVEAIGVEAVPAAYWYGLNLSRFANKLGMDARMYYRDRLLALMRRLAVVQSSLRERGVLASRITLSGERRPERVVARLARRQEVSSGAARAAAAPRVTDESSRPEGLARRAVEGD
ncbi:MAG: hypothetical protein KC933_26015 [Myxococcales bacterium]|nr:hypothetical protein [Myxococcales bacterium]